jgi:hypothetical protein
MTTTSAAKSEAIAERARDDAGSFSTGPLLNILELIFAGAPLGDVLASIARLVESQVNGMHCTIWLPDEDGKHVRCAAARIFGPSRPYGDRAAGCVVRHGNLSEATSVR